MLRGSIASGAGEVGGNREVKIWNVASKSLQHTITVNRADHYPVAPPFFADGPWSKFPSITFISRGAEIAVADGGSTVGVWDTKTGKQQRSFQLESELVRIGAITISEDGRYLAGAGSNQAITLWDAKTRKELAIIRGHSSNVTSLAFSRDGLSLLSGSVDKTVKLWDVAMKQSTQEAQQYTFPPGADLPYMAYSPDESSLAVFSQTSGNIEILDLATGGTLTIFLGHVHDAVFSPDGSLLASSGSAFGPEPTSRIKFWEMASGKEVASWNFNSGMFSKLTFSSDGRYLAAEASRNDGSTEVKLWDVARRKEIAEEPSFPLGRRTGGDEVGPITCLEVNGAAKIFPKKSLSKLIEPVRGGCLSFKDRDVMWKRNDSLLSSRVREPIQWNSVILEKLASTVDLTESFISRLRLCATGGQWQALQFVFDQASQSGLGAHPLLRQEYICQTAIMARTLALAETRQFPESLWMALFHSSSPNDWMTPRFALPMADAFSTLLANGEELDGCTAIDMVSTFIKGAPQNSLESMGDKILQNRSTDLSLKGHDNLREFARKCREVYPNSLKLMRFAQAVDAYDVQSLEWSDLTETILSQPDVTIDDFTQAARNAAYAIPYKHVDVARSLLERLVLRFDKSAEAQLTAAWSYFYQLQDTLSALKHFESALQLLKEGDEPSIDALLGLAATQWLNNKGADGMLTYKRIIENGLKQVPLFEDWRNVNTIKSHALGDLLQSTLDQIRIATLASYPEINQIQSPKISVPPPAGYYPTPTK